MPPENKLDKVLGSLLTAEMRELVREMRVSLADAEKLQRKMKQKLVSVKRARIVKGELYIEFTDGITQNLGRIVARDGIDGQFITSAKVESGQLVVTTNDGKVIRAGNVQGLPGKDGTDYVLTDDDMLEIAIMAEDKLRKHVDNALEAENLAAIINNGKHKIDASRITGLVDQARLDARFANTEQMIRTAVHRAAVTIKNADGDKIGTQHNLKFVGATAAHVGDDIVITIAAGETASHGTLTNLTADDHTQYTIISSGAGAPGTTPPRVGALYVDTTNDDVYVGTATASSADWTQVNSADGALLAANNLSDVASASTARTNLGLGTAAVTDTGTSSGNVPVLDGSGKLSTSVLPSLAISEYGGDFADLATALADAGVQALQRGDWFTVQTGGGATYIVTTDSPTTGGDVTLLSTPTDAVSSVNGATGVVVLDADDIDDAATTHKFATAAQLAKVDYLTVTQAVDLDTLESNVATNNAKVGVTTQISNVVEDTSPQAGGDFDMNGNNLTDVQEIRLDATPDADHSATGATTNTINAGATIAIGELVYLASDGEWALADASATGTAEALLGVALAAGTDGASMLTALPGSFVRDDTWAWTVGGQVFISETAGDLTQTAPSTTDSVVRVVGYAVSADVIYFMPQQGVVHV